MFGISNTMPLGILCQNQVFDNWDITTSYPFTKVEAAGYQMLLTASVNTNGMLNTNWLKAETKHKFVGISEIDFNLTATNYISSNPTNAGITHLIFARCYDEGDTYLGSIGFGYVFFINATQKAGIYIIKDLRDVGGDYTSAEVSGALAVPSFNASDVFKLSINTVNRNWDISKDLYKVDCDTSLGLIPSGTAYIRYQSIFNVGASIVGTAEINVMNIH
jgi:hypothetical protein